MAEITFDNVYKVNSHTAPYSLIIPTSFSNGAGGTVNFYVSYTQAKPANIAAMEPERLSIAAQTQVRMESMPRWVAWEQATGTSVVNENGILNPVGFQTAEG